MAVRVSFYENELIFILGLLNLKFIPGRRFDTQRGSVIIAERNGALFAVKIAAKDKYDTEQGIVPSRSQGILNEIEVVKKIGGSFFPVFDSQIITDKFVAVSFDFIEGVNGFCIPVEYRIRAIIDLFKAVAKLHSFGYAHGDIHPRNIIFRGNFLDFYSIALIDLELSNNLNNVVSTYPGKVDYLSPESAKDVIKTGFVQKPTEQDIYAFGVSILSILLGKEIKRFAFNGLSREQKLEYIASEHVVFDLSQVNSLLADTAKKILEIINKPEAERPIFIVDFLNQIGLNMTDMHSEVQKKVTTPLLTNLKISI